MLADEMLALTKGTDAIATRSTGMTLRERFRRTMAFQSVDRLPNWEFGYWAETLNNWHAQGLPPEVTDEASAYRWFGIEPWGAFAPVNVMGLVPGFPYTVVSEDADYTTYRDGDGALARINRHGDKSIPHYLEFAIKGRADWERFREHLRPHPSRIPADLAARGAALKDREVPLFIGIGSMIGSPRNWIGFENIAMMVHDDPELLEEIVETCCQLVCSTLEQALPHLDPDIGAGWEDICFNSGPIVGARFMRDVVKPRYQRITGLLRKHGCDLAWTDCDGNILPILDSFVDGGINVMFPVEVHGGSDPLALRRRQPGLRMNGGFDKMALLQGKAAIRAELERLLPLVREGGFIPGVDHRVQADVSYENYRWYLKLKRELYGAGGTPQYDESAL
jgi:hypothetical protein